MPRTRTAACAATAERISRFGWAGTAPSADRPPAVRTHLSPLFSSCFRLAKLISPFPRGLRGVLQEAGLHTEAVWVDITLRFLSGEQGPIDDYEARVAHLVRMVGEMNRVAT